jgi:hypothetical protein
MSRSFSFSGDSGFFCLRAAALERLDANARLTEIPVVTNWFREVEGKVRGH